VASTALRRAAVLETSFWIAAYRAEVIANCFDIFEIVVPRAVEAEIRSVDPDNPRREFPYATLFRHLRGLLLEPPPEAPTPLPLFGPGEAEAIVLADHLGVHLLINERRAGDYAANLGIAVVTVPAVIVLLRAEGIIGARAAERKLDLISPITAREMVERARRALDAL
jgi:hypothetical protein